MDRNVKADASSFGESSERLLEEGHEKATANRKDSAGIKNPQEVEGARRFSGVISISDTFGRFYERNYYLDPLEYKRDGDEPGLVLILNQEHFEGAVNPTRHGSKKDVEDIITCFGRLGFNINRKDHLFEDLSRDSVLKKFDEVLRSDLSQINSVLVFILSHGRNCNIIACKDGYFKLEDILTKFEKCTALKGKPKMFVIQACKGDDTTNLSSHDKSNKMIVPWSTFEEIYSDMLIIYSTLEGKYSYRDEMRGTWLIQEICKNFTAYGWRDDVLSLSSRVKMRMHEV